MLEPITANPGARCRFLHPYEQEEKIKLGIHENRRRAGKHPFSGNKVQKTAKEVRDPKR